MSDALLEAIAALDKQCREQATEIENLKSIVRLHDERLDAQGMLLASPRRRDAVRHYEMQLAQIQGAA